MAEKLDLEALERSCHAWDYGFGDAPFIDTPLVLQLIARIRELERAQPAAVAAVPAGYVLVPRTMTREMYIATGLVKDAPFRLWNDLLAAAEAPKQEGN